MLSFWLRFSISAGAGFGLGFDWLGLSFALHTHVHVMYGMWVHCTWLQADGSYAWRAELHMVAG